jgi:hypothetical protein
MTFMPDDLQQFREKVCSLITPELVSSARAKYPGVSRQLLVYGICMDIAMKGFQALQDAAVSARRSEVDHLHAIISHQTEKLASVQLQGDGDSLAMPSNNDSDLEAKLDLKYQGDNDELNSRI